MRPYRSKWSVWKAGTVLLAFAGLVAPSSPALAAPAPVTSYDVQSRQTNRGRVVSVTAQLPATARLPAELRIAVPKDATIQWVREILLGDPAKDPQAKYTLWADGAANVVVFRLTRSRIGQVAALVSGALPTKNGVVEADLDFMAVTAASSVSLAVAVPSGTTIVSGTPGASNEGDAGGGFGWYLKMFGATKAGQRLALKVAYRNPASTSPAQSQRSTSGRQPVSLPVAIAVLAAIVTGSLAALKRIQVSAQRGADRQ